MRVLCLLVFLGLPLTATAQKASPPETSDLLIVAYKLGPIVRIDISKPDPFVQLEGRSAVPEINPPRSEWQAKAEIKLRNTGSKPVKIFDCELLLRANFDTENTFRPLSMHFMRTIPPGDTLTVSRWIRADNLKAWRRPQKERLLKVQANITRIVYGDGSVWERGPLRLPLRN